LLPAHVAAAGSAAGGARATGAWLVDGFGAAHPLVAARVVVGRRPDADLSIQNTTVSRDHAVLRREGDGWQLRDLGSRNGSFVDDQRVSGRARIAASAAVRFGGVGFYLIDAPRGLPGFEVTSVDTTHATDAVRYQLAAGEVELCLIGAAAGDHADDETTGGVLLHRRRGDGAWRELSLPRLEHQLLQLLCEQAASEPSSPAPTRGAVPTRTLSTKLAFHSRFANEENVRQVVRRARTSLAEIGAGELIASVPGRGYYLSWPLTVS
jgi:hypothetical protein